MLANSHRALVEDAVRVVVEQIEIEPELDRPENSQGIAVAYPNLSAILGCPSPAARTAATGFPPRR